MIQEASRTKSVPTPIGCDPDRFGHDRLQQALAAAPAAAGAAEVLASVETVIREFRGAIEPFDDATMMAVRVGGGATA